MHQNLHTSQRGFTIVEIAIVLLVIGFIIGGILGGRELIANNQVSKISTQTLEIDSAFTIFKKNYGELPGDISNITGLPNCTAAPCTTVGDGNGLINETQAAWVGPLTVTDERSTAWAHLNAARLLGGMDGSTDLEPGRLFPSNARRGPWLVGVMTSNATYNYTSANVIFPAANLLIENGADSWRNLMTAQEVYRIDQKIDDGVANSGKMQSVQGCRTGPTAATYDIVQTNFACTYFYALQTQN